ncbi:MAG TPA: lipid II flippase MurJ [Candidatus Angelobacter sp.]
MISRALQAIGLQPAAPDRPLTANWKILRAIVIVSLCSIVAKGAATAKELVVAARFGRGDSVDAFLIALLVPTTILGLVASTFNVALIPTYIRVREEQGAEAAQQLFSSVQVASLVLLGIVSILVAAGAHFYLPLLGSGFDAAKLLLTQRLLYVLLPFIVLNGAIAIWSAVLNAGERFALPALTPMVTPLVAVLTLLIFGRRWGIFSLAVGTVAGSGLEVFVLGCAMRIRGLRLRLRWCGITPELNHVLGQYLPMLGGALFMSTAPIIDQSMAAMLKPGSVAALLYGNRIVNVVTMLTSAAMATAVLPYFSQMTARKDWSGCRRTLKVYSLLILLVTIPITLVLVAGSPLLTRLLYQRGAFTQADTTVVSGVQICFAFMIPVYTWCALLVRFISSLHRNDLLAYLAVLSAVLNVILNLALMKWLGVAGIALSTSLVYLISCALLGFSALKLLREKREKQVEGVGQ